MAATRIVVAIPWRPQPARLRAYDFVRGWWAGVLPDAPVVEVDTTHQPFNLAACRNLGVRQAEALDADVVVIADADVVLDNPGQILEAIDEAGDGRLHLPFAAQLYLTEEESLALTERGIRPGRTATHGNGCCYVATPDAYWACGGSDERFSGWGGDDDGLVAAAMALIGVKRHQGNAYSLWHADECRDVGSERHRPNAELAARYWQAVESQTAMRALIAERS